MRARQNHRVYVPYFPPDMDTYPTDEHGEHWAPGGIAIISCEEGERQRRAAFDRRTAIERRVERGGLWSAFWSLFFGIEMFSSDPTTARQAIVYTGMHELRAQQERTAIQQARSEQLAQAQRMQDRADEERRMAIMGKAIAQEMFAEADRRNGSAAS